MKSMNHRSTYGLKHTVGLLLLVLCPTCKQAPSSDTNAEGAAAPTPSAQSAQNPSAQVKSAVAPQPGSECAGKYQGEYTVAAVKSELSSKDGAPSQWEKDDGKALAGKGTIQLQVDANNSVSGMASGALGEQTLRGSCDDKTLRVRLDSTNEELAKVQNAYLLAEISGADIKGTLAAATGDSLIRRAGAVTLQRAQ
jgi:hypothetical protein